MPVCFGGNLSPYVWGSSTVLVCLVGFSPMQGPFCAPPVKGKGLWFVRGKFKKRKGFDGLSFYLFAFFFLFFSFFGLFSFFVVWLFLCLLYF